MGKGIYERTEKQLEHLKKIGFQNGVRTPKSLETREKMSDYWIEFYKNNPDAHKGKNNPMYGKKRVFTTEWKKNLSVARKNRIFTDATIRKILKSCKNSPNKAEQKLNKIIQEIFKKEYKFVGDGKVIIGGFCPDFINVNGQKKIIELYGDYWHNKKEVIERDNRRVKTYKKYGYKTLIVWEHELKEKEILKNKLDCFGGFV